MHTKTKQAKKLIYVIKNLTIRRPLSHSVQLWGVWHGPHFSQLGDIVTCSWHRSAVLGQCWCDFSLCHRSGILLQQGEGLAEVTVGVRVSEAEGWYTCRWKGRNSDRWKGIKKKKEWRSRNKADKRGRRSVCGIKDGSRRGRDRSDKLWGVRSSRRMERWVVERVDWWSNKRSSNVQEGRQEGRAWNKGDEQKIPT